MMTLHHRIKALRNERIAFGGDRGAPHISCCPRRVRRAAKGVPWDELDIVVDCSLVADLTRGYAQLKHHCR